MEGALYIHQIVSKKGLSHYLNYQDQNASIGVESPEVSRVEWQIFEEELAIIRAMLISVISHRSLTRRVPSLLSSLIMPGANPLVNEQVTLCHSS